MARFLAEGLRSYYFIGKDNIPFHTIIWRRWLMGYGGLNLPLRCAGERIPDGGEPEKVRKAITGRCG